MDHQPFDTAAKELIWEDPAAWLTGTGEPEQIHANSDGRMVGR